MGLLLTVGVTVEPQVGLMEFVVGTLLLIVLTQIFIFIDQRNNRSYYVFGERRRRYSSTIVTRTKIAAPQNGPNAPNASNAQASHEISSRNVEDVEDVDTDCLVVDTVETSDCDNEPRTQCKPNGQDNTDKVNHGGVNDNDEKIQHVNEANNNDIDATNIYAANGDLDRSLISMRIRVNDSSFIGAANNTMESDRNSDIIDDDDMDDMKSEFKQSEFTTTAMTPQNELVLPQSEIKNDSGGDKDDDEEHDSISDGDEKKQESKRDKEYDQDNQDEEEDDEDDDDNDDREFEYYRYDYFPESGSKLDLWKNGQTFWEKHKVFAMYYPAQSGIEIIFRALFLTIIVGNVYLVFYTITMAPVTFEIGGLVESFISNPVRTYSVWEVATLLPQRTDKTYDAYALSSVYYVSAIFAPLIVAILICFVWLLPSSLKMHKLFLHLLFPLQAWSSLDVFWVASVAASLELEEVSQWIINQQLESVCGTNGTMQRIIGKGCFSVKGRLTFGAWLMLISTVTMWITLIFTIVYVKYAHEKMGYLSFGQKKSSKNLK